MKSALDMLPDIVIREPKREYGTCYALAYRTDLSERTPLPELAGVPRHLRREAAFVLSAAIGLGGEATLSELSAVASARAGRGKEWGDAAVEAVVPHLGMMARVLPIGGYPADALIQVNPDVSGRAIAPLANMPAFELPTGRQALQREIGLRSATIAPRLEEWHVGLLAFVVNLGGDATEVELRAQFGRGQLELLYNPATRPEWLVRERGGRRYKLHPDLWPLE
jgi:hypothetical protein